MMASTQARILAGLALGLAVGLIYGWLIRPVEYVDTSPDSLRADFRADYVLMVAEAYAAEDDLELAKRRLAILGPDPAHQLVAEALRYADRHDFAAGDLGHLRSLASDLERRQPTPEIGSP